MLVIVFTCYVQSCDAWGLKYIQADRRDKAGCNLAFFPEVCRMCLQMCWSSGSWEGEREYFLQVLISVYEKMRSSLTPSNSCKGAFTTSWATLSQLCVDNDCQRSQSGHDLSNFIWSCVETMSWTGSVSIMLIAANRCKWLTWSSNQRDQHLGWETTSSCLMWCFSSATQALLFPFLSLINLPSRLWMFPAKSRFNFLMHLGVKWKWGLHRSGCIQVISKDGD